MKRHTFFQLILIALLLGGCLPVSAGPTALDEYVARADADYRYSHRDTRNGEGYTIFALSLDSLRWRSPDEVSPDLWQHDVQIAVPWVPYAGNRHTAFLIVNGGRNKPGSETQHDELLGLLAVTTGAVTAMINQVPNQPLRFADEEETRTEDAILAYGMDKYLLTADPEWLAHLPMTKAVVRAMDAIQAFTRNPGDVFPKPPRIDDFIVGGGSKRGWTTWLVAAVEAGKGSASRVRAILPASIDLLNLGKQFLHHWEAYGFYAPAIQDYVDFDLPCRAQTPAGREMLRLIDPYEYRDRLTMPKLVVNSTGDQFFLPDSSQFYFADLPGPKLLRYNPNTDHAQDEDLEAVVLPALSWLIDSLDGDQSPRYSWSFEPDGSIRVRTLDRPDRVRLWQATNPKARDFRLETLGPVWTSRDLQETSPGVYVGYVAPPPRGWTAFMVELTFPDSSFISDTLDADEVYTTDVRVTPPDLPFAGTACPGYRTPLWLPVKPARANHLWTLVDAPTGFTDPVVIAGPPSFNGVDPGVVRLRDSNAAGFYLRFQEWDYRQRLFGDKNHAVEDIPYLVVQAGRHLMSDGSVWEAGHLDVQGTGAWRKASFAQPFAAPPYLFLTVQTTNGGQAVSARARNVTATGFEAALFEEEALMDGHVAEKLGYLAIHSPAAGGLMTLAGTEVAYLLQQVSADHRWVPALSQRLKLEEEQSRDPELVHTPESLHLLAVGRQFLAQQVSHRGADTTALRRLAPSDDAPMEWGLVRGIDHQWRNLPFANLYRDPVVVAKPASSRGASPGVIRLRNLSGDKAQLRFQEWDYLDGPHAPEDVFYLVTEAGQHQLGGLRVEADWLGSDKLGRLGQWEAIGFHQPFSAKPVVLTSVMSANEDAAVTTRIRGLNPAGFELAMDEEEAQGGGHLEESLGWIGIQTGTDRTSAGRRFNVFFAPISDSWKALSYGGTTAHQFPSVIADIDSSYSLDPVTLRYTKPTSSQISLRLGEEQSLDGETAHAAEDIGIFVSE